jgi:hypothetical protein
MRRRGRSTSVSGPAEPGVGASESGQEETSVVARWLAVTCYLCLRGDSLKIKLPIDDVWRPDCADAAEAG